MEERDYLKDLAVMLIEDYYTMIIISTLIFILLGTIIGYYYAKSKYIKQTSNI